MLENWTLGPKAMLPSVTERHLNIPASFMGVKMAFLRGSVWIEGKSPFQSIKKCIYRYLIMI